MTKLEPQVVLHIEEMDDETDIKTVAIHVDDAAIAENVASEIDGKLSWKVILAFIVRRIPTATIETS